MFNLVARKPELGSNVFVAPSAAVVGSVTLGDRASVWYGTVLRGARCLKRSSALQCYSGSAGL